MYESFYGLRGKPFTLLPDPEYLYLSPKHQRALTLLEYGMMHQAGFSVICGDIGAGKTTLIRRLLNEFGDDVTVGLITNTHRSFGELLNWVLMAFGMDSEGMGKPQMHNRFVNFLIEQYARNKRTVLIVDEAQNMDAGTLEELRMLSNINADKDQVLQVILAGQPALRDNLRKPELIQFAQRIAVDYYLQPLNKEETFAYIHHRLKVAGAHREIFTAGACDAVYRYSGGTPRLINLLCDTALVYGFAEQTPQIDAQLVEDVVKEQHAHGVVSSFNIEENETLQERNIRQRPAKTETVATEVLESMHEKVSAVVAEVERESAVIQAGQDAGPEKQEPDAAPGEEVSSVKPVSDHGRESRSQNPVADRVRADDFNDQRFAENKVSGTAQGKQAFAADLQASGWRHRAPLESEGAADRKDKEGDRINTNYLLLGLAGGMFLASLIMVVAGYFLFSKNEVARSQEASTVRSSPLTADDSANRRRKADVDEVQLEAIRKQRDAMLALSRALERERDAALASARAQEDMREARRRVAELMIRQEGRSLAEIERARESARQTEIVAARAREQERLAQQQVARARIDVEGIDTGQEAAGVESAAPDATESTGADRP